MQAKQIQSLKEQVDRINAMTSKFPFNFDHIFAAIEDSVYADPIRKIQEDLYV